MKQFLKIITIALMMLGNGSVCVCAQEFQPDLQRLALMMLSEKATGDVDDMPYLNYLDSLGFKKSDSDIRLGKMGFGEIFYKKGFGKDTVQVVIRNMKNDDGRISRSANIKMTSDMMECQMIEQLKAFGMEEVEKYANIMVLSGNGLVAGIGEKIMILRCVFTPSQSYLEGPIASEDGKGRMDTIKNSVVCRIETADKVFVDTLISSGEPEIDVYPKYVHSFAGKGGSTVYLFVYSMGHLFFYDEAAICAVKKDGNVERCHFVTKDERNTKLGCMWWDQLVAASNGFPYEYENSPDEERFGIHCVMSLRSVYIPIMDYHDSGSEFANTNCLQYTGRFNVFRFNGTDFWYDGTDGAWWLNPDLRNYKRTISNRKTPGGIEQVDLMPDGTYRRAFWKGAKTLDDLRKEPDEVKIISTI